MTSSIYDDAESTPDAGELPELDLTPRAPRQSTSSGRLSFVAIVLVLVIGALLSWPYSRGWGYYPSGGLGLVLLILLILLLMGRI